MKKILTIIIILILLGFGIYKIINNKTVQEGVGDGTIDNLVENNFNLLQGQWISVDDEKSVIEFMGDKKIDIYDGEIMEEIIFKLYKELPDGGVGEEDANGEYMTAEVNGDVFQYKIIDLSSTKLSLMFLPRGNILEYRR